MTKKRTLQILRGTTVQNDAYTGSAGELTMDTTTNELRLHDGSTAGGHVIGSGGGGSGYHPDLFDWKWADHELNDMQWLRADTFSWQDGTAYESAYQHLADEYTSSDWTPTRQEPLLGNNTYYAIAYDGTKFVALSGGGYITTSTDGITWTGATAEFNSTTWNGLAYNGTKFVALRNKGYISTSTDGITWSEPTQDPSIADFYSWKALASDGTKFVAIDTSGYISTSTDGTTWTTATYVTNLGNHAWNDIIYDGTKFVAIGANGYISTSTNGTTWSAATQNTELNSVNYWQSLAYDGTQFIAINTNGYTSTSTDGTTWTTPTQNNNLSGHNWYAIAYGGAKFVVLGSPYNVSTKTPAQEETIAGITVEFCLASDGHKICAADQESNVTAIYNATGVAWYYILDTVNERFKLPRRHSQKIVRSVKNADGSWYRLYADGWVEQGGVSTTANDTTVTITLPITMSNANYVALKTCITDNSFLLSNISFRTFAVAAKTTTSFQTFANQHSTNGFDWQVSGQSAIDMSSFQDGEKYLYFYMGQFTQTALENTAGLNASLFNGKADIDLTNAVSNASSVAKETIVGWGLPDYSAGINVTSSLFNNKSYTAPSKGVLFNAMIPTYNTDIKINGNSVGTRLYSTYGNWIPTPYYLNKGDIFSVSGWIGNSGGAYFFPLKGVN